MHTGGGGGGYSLFLGRCLAAHCGSVGSLHTFAFVGPLYEVLLRGIDSLRSVGEWGGGGRLAFSGGGFVLFVFAVVTRLFSLSSAFGGGLLLHRHRCVYGGMHTCVRAYGHTSWLFLLAGLFFLYCVSPSYPWGTRVLAGLFFLCVSRWILFAFAIFFVVVCVALVPSLLSYLGILMCFHPIRVGYAGGGVHALHATCSRRRLCCRGFALLPSDSLHVTYLTWQRLSTLTLRYLYLSSCRHLARGVFLLFFFVVVGSGYAPLPSSCGTDFASCFGARNG